MSSTLAPGGVAMGLLALALAGAPGYPEAASVHKCTNSAGQTIYQEAPCEKTGSTGGKLELKDPLGAGERAGKSSGKVKGADGTGQSMKDAFNRRMDARDYDGALAFATTDAQKAQARKMIAQKNAKCATLSQKMQKSQAEVRPDNARSKAAAEAAASEYALNCR